MVLVGENDSQSHHQGLRNRHGGVDGAARFRGVPAVSEWVELISDSELNGRVVLAELVLVGIVAGLLISANPVG